MEHAINFHQHVIQYVMYVINMESVLNFQHDLNAI